MELNIRFGINTLSYHATCLGNLCHNPSRSTCVIKGRYIRKYSAQLVLELRPKRTKNEPITPFYWMIKITSARQWNCTKDVSLCNISKICCSITAIIAKIELGSTSCNDCSNKNVARLVVYVTRHNFYGDLYCNTIARQVAKQIA